MKSSSACIDMIKQFEGCRLKAYKSVDTEKNYTIGYGHCTADVRSDMVINQEEAEYYLKLDITAFEKKVDKYSSYEFSQNEYDALVCFCFNVGNIDQLTANGKRSKAEIAEKMLLYTKSGGKVIQGLVKRRQAEHDLFLKGSIATESSSTIMLGHSSIDENGKTHGGKAGDQTTKEVCIRNFYDKGWNLILRCKDKVKAEKMAEACELGCINPHVGYDQYQRNSLRQQAETVGFDLSRISNDCECDCSSFMAVCAECAGIKIPYDNGNAPTTKTMRKKFLSTGKFEAYNYSREILKRGDILVKEGSHTAMVL